MRMGECWYGFVLMPLNVGRSVHDGGLNRSRNVRPQIQYLRCLGHLGIQDGVGVDDRGTTVVGAVHERGVVNRKQRHGYHAEPYTLLSETQYNSSKSQGASYVTLGNGDPERAHAFLMRETDTRKVLRDI